MRWRRNRHCFGRCAGVRRHGGAKGATLTFMAAVKTRRSLREAGAGTDGQEDFRPPARAGAAQARSSCPSVPARLRRSERLVFTAGHEVSVAPLAPPVPPGHRRIDRSNACFAASAWACTRFQRRCRAIDDQRSFAKWGNISVQTESTCLPAGNMVTTTCAPLTARAPTPQSPRVALRRRTTPAPDQPRHLAPGLREVGGIGRPCCQDR